MCYIAEIFADGPFRMQVSAKHCSPSCLGLYPSSPSYVLRIQYLRISSHAAVQDLLAPHASVLILFASSAQTHIFPEIRVDAVRFINLFLEYVPDAMVTGWNQGTSQPGGRVLEGYLGILSAGTKFGDNEGMPGLHT